MNGAFVIAEGGLNHNGRFDLAEKLVDLAAEAGADAVKFQAYVSEDIISVDAEKAKYQKENSGPEGETQLQMAKKLELPLDDFAKLKKRCDDRGVVFLTTPFDLPSLKVIASLAPALKISSGEITHKAFVKACAKTGKPVILSTGMSTLDEVRHAVEWLGDGPKAANGFPPLTLLHCTTNYPANVEDLNLRAMLTLRDAFALPVGYSDHSLGIEASIAAVAMGATVIEKHFTIDRSMDGPDHRASLDPNDLAAMIRAIRNVEKALGDGVKKPTASELPVRDVARRSLVAAKPLKAGERLTPDNVRCKRPGTGIQPAELEEALGKTLRRDLREDQVINWDDLDDE